MRSPWRWLRRLKCTSGGTRPPRRRALAGPLRLEDRITPAFTVTDTANLLTFVGDSASQSLAVWATQTQILYRVNNGSAIALTNAKPSTLQSVVVRGGAGNDNIDLSGLAQHMTAMASGGGADVSGGAGNDVLRGTPYDDILEGGAGADQLLGEEGNDTLRAFDFEADIVTGGVGHDSAIFDSLDLPSECEVWNPYQPAPDNQRHKVKVLVLNYDPLIASRGNRPLHEVFNWTDPSVILATYEEALERTSGGYIDFEITDWRNLNATPAFEDGFAYDPEQYVQLWEAGGPWHPGTVDYPRMMAENHVPQLVDAGLVDEVWFYGAPAFGGFESAMMGPGSFWINGATYPQVPSSRAFAVHGGNYERYIDVLLHGTGHRTESTMERTYGGWNLADPQSNWDKFSANAQQSNGLSGVGTAHFPANGVDHYDYANTRTVQSNADDFLDYPNLDNVTRPITRESWGILPGDEFQNGMDYQHDYFQWFYTRFPRAAGVNADGKQNNWWKYVFDFNNYTEDGKALPLRVHQARAADIFNLGATSHTFTVAYSGAIPIDISSIDASDVKVTAPNGAILPVTLVGVSDPTNGTYRVATYQVTAPGGTWDVADRGNYTISLNAGAVRNSLNQTLPAQNLATFAVRTATASALPADGNTTLLLKFDGNLTGAAGEVPQSNSGVSFVPGVLGQAAAFGVPATVTYPVVGNLPVTAGTIEFWLRPNWDASTPDYRSIVKAGSFPDQFLDIGLDVWDDSLRFVLGGDDPSTPTIETNHVVGVSTGPVPWRAGEWHHVAATWDNSTHRIALYIDGRLIDEKNNAPIVIGYGSPQIRIGDSEDRTADVTIDEFRISNRARPGGEIATDYASALALTALQPKSPTLTLEVPDRRAVEVTASGPHVAGLDVTRQVVWVSSNPAVVAVDPDGKFRAVAPGTATLTGKLDALTTTVQVTVTNPGKPTATLTSAPNITDGSQSSYSFQVTYTDNSAIQLATVGSGDVRVFGPNGFSRPGRLVSLSAPQVGTVVATYDVSLPSQTWDERDNGVYTIELLDWQVADTQLNYLARKILGQFQVQIQGGAPITRPPLPAELTEQNASDWNPWADSATAMVSDDFSRKLRGQSSLRFETTGGYDTSLSYLRGKNALWDLTAYSSMHIGFFAENDHGFQEASPWIRLKTSSGSYYEYRYVVNGNPVDILNDAIGRWQEYDIPLNAGANVTQGWRRTTVGTPSLDRITKIEIHSDTWDFGFKLWVDALSFQSATNDTVAPSSSVKPLPAKTLTESFQVEWSGQDNVGGSGIASYDVFVSRDGGVAVPWLIGTTLTTATFPGAVNHDYAFYSVAVDRAGNREAAPLLWDTMTTVPGGMLSGVVFHDPNGNGRRDTGEGVLPNRVIFLDLDGDAILDTNERRVSSDSLGRYQLTSLLPGTGTLRQVLPTGWVQTLPGTPGHAVTVTVGSTRTNLDFGSRLNQPPRVEVNTGLTLAEGSTAGISSTQLRVVDPDAPNTPVTYRLTEVPRFGKLLLSGVALAVSGQFTQADINGGRLRYQQDGSETTSDLFRFTATDALGASLPVTAFALRITQVNDAPVLLGDGVAMRPILEDTVGPAGESIVTILGTTVRDVDPGALKGMAVVGVTGGTFGRWQYSLNGGGSWLDLPAVSASKGLLLSDANKLRFVPAAHWFGSVTLTYRAWDRTSGTPGTLADLLVVGGTSAFSVTTAKTTLTVTPVNDSPKLSGDGVMQDVPEDSVNPPGDLIRTILGNTYSDADPNSLRGIAVVGLTATDKGRWQYSLNGGTTWGDFGIVSANAARLLRETDKVRFLPNANYAGLASMTYRGWDQTTHFAGAVVALPWTVVGGSTAFSKELATARLTVKASNDAPVLNALIRPQVGVLESTVSSLLSAAQYRDVDGTTSRGLAIVGATGLTDGTWQYSIDNGLSWVNLPAVSEAQARLLRDSDRVRFVPRGTYRGVATLSFRGWDQTVGSVGGVVDLTGGNKVGGRTAFSAEVVTAEWKR